MFYRLLFKPFSSLFIWVVLSTVLPSFLRFDVALSPAENKDGYLFSSSAYQLNSHSIVSNGLTNTHVLLVTAHPDDESMFFTPTILELAKLNYNNTLHVVCFSNGNYDGLGEIRQREIRKAAAFLGISSVDVLDYKDNITQFWDYSDIAASLSRQIEAMKLTTTKLTLLTFDEKGVSNHPNHKSLFFGVLRFMDTTSRKDVQFFKLRSWPIYEKYSGFFWVRFELLWKYLSRMGWVSTFEGAAARVNISMKPTPGSVKIFNDFNNWVVSLATMTSAHYSQIVWYRWFWIFVSKYMNSNELIRVI